MRYFILILLFFVSVFADSIESYNTNDGDGFKTWDYIDNGRYKADIFLMHTTKIEFNKGERVIDTSLVDVTCIRSWFIKKNRDAIFVTALKNDCDTILRVQTSKTQYFLELNAKLPIGNFKKELVLIYNFAYPEEDNNAEGGANGIDFIRFNTYSGINCDPIDKTKNNYNYSISENSLGKRVDRDIAPSLIFDDGKFTYMKFPNKVPSIFAVDSNGFEVSTNVISDGKDCIRVDGVGTRYSLKLGPALVCVFNEAFENINRARIK